jgi:hypothetical protein
MMQAIELSQKMQKCRDTAKRFFKDEFPEKLKPYIELLEAVMKSKSIDEIPALLEISKTETYQSDGMVQMMFMAATVELIEFKK